MIREQRPAVRIIVDVREHASGQSSLVVYTPDGMRQTVLLAASAADAALDAELPARCQPVAARFELTDQGPDCTCLVTTPGGPRRIALSLPAALAVLRRGVHGIVTQGSSGARTSVA